MALSLPTPVKSWKNDVFASMVVFLVALPLCMGIALASGVPTEKAAAVGLITAIVGGLVVGSLGGSPLQVSGPAAGLSVIIFELTRQHGWEKVGVIVLLAGCIQFVAGLLRLGQWFRAVSPAVIAGMLAGIGVLIFSSQFHIMLDDAPKENGLANLLSLPEAFWQGIVPTNQDTHDDAARIGLLTIALLILWKKLAGQKFKVIPPAIVAIAVATLVTVFGQLPIKQVAVPDSLLEAIQVPSFPPWDQPASWQPLLLAGLSVAFIASAETLLCAVAVDKLHQGPRTQYDKELATQGFGNMICGLLGALPMTGVIVRSAANVEAGAQSRLSAILHGLWILGIVVFFPFILRYIPTASLAALLVYTGFKLVDPQVVRNLWSFGKSEVVIYAITVVTIVATDLLTGVLVGIGCALVKLIYTFTHLKVRLVKDMADGRTILYLRGAATFLRLPKLAAVLESVPPSTELHVHFEDLTYIDHACLDLFISWEKQHETTGGRLEIDWESLHARFQPYPRNPINVKGRNERNGIATSARNPGTPSFPGDGAAGPKSEVHVNSARILSR